MKRKNILVIGGGTGTFTVLSGLKKYPVDLSVIVSMTDSGGSNRVIRDEFGLLPTSDIRQCMVALASQDSDEILRKLFTYRYNHGTGISGMTFGNLFMAALTEIYGSQERAIEKTCDLLKVRGKIIPVTYNDCHLVARYENGKQVLGEHTIDEPSQTQGKYKIVELEVFPKARANKEAIKAIEKADLIIFAPGDLYTSLICNLVVGGMVPAIRKSKARKAYIVNLMTKFGQTNNMTTGDHVNELNRYLGGKIVDTVFINNKNQYPDEILERYKEEKAFPIIDNAIENGIKVIRGDFVSKIIFKKVKSDTLKRSLIRHSPEKLAKAIISIL